jgi:hypothetical protein
MNDLIERMNMSACSMGLALDPDLSTVQVDAHGVVHVVATPDAFPHSADERRMQSSALHACLLEDLSECVSKDRLHVCVHAPPFCPETQTVVSSWIRTEITVVREYFVQSIRMLCRASCLRIINTYPWRAKDVMLTRMHTVVMKRLNASLDRGCRDPFLADACLDHLLIPMEQLLPCSKACEVVLDDLARHVTPLPESLLMRYETLYYVYKVATDDVSPTTQYLARTVFCI